jgi:hypothetical protein
MDAIVAVGSILDVTEAGGDPAEVMMSARLALLCDRSASMSDRDADSRPKYQIEDEVVSSLQRRYRGQIVLVSFSTHARIELSGTLPTPNGMTNLAGALDRIRPIVDAGIRVCVISDGYPDDAEAALRVARSLKYRLDCIYIGRAGSEGDLFMQRLAAEVGGTHQVNEAAKSIENMIETLLLSAG